MKINKIYVWTAWFLSIVLLFILSQTNLILKENSPKVYQVSLILDSEDESEYSNLKKGVDDAAKRYNIDINLRTIGSASQKELIESEEDNGTNGIIVLAKDDLKLAMTKVPMVVIKSKDADIFDTKKFVGSSANIATSKRTINIDYVGMITGLYNKFENSYDGVSPIYVFYNSTKPAGVDPEIEFLKSKDEPFVFIEGDEKEFRTAIEDLVHSKKSAYIFSLDKHSSDNLCKILGGSSVYNEHIKGFYCIGATTLFVNKLDDGNIDALSTLNEYDEGYLAVEMLMADLKKTGYTSNIDMKNILLDKESLKDEDIVKQLFPVE